MSNTPTRDSVLDIIKGLCILCVVYGHVVTEGTLHDFVYMFHVGVFFLISGYFLHPDKEKGFGTFLIKKAKGLYIPYLLLCIPLWLGNNLLLDMHWVNEYKDWAEIGKRIVVCLTFQGSPFLALQGWFLKSLFFALGLTYLVVKHVKVRWQQYAIFGGLYLCGYLLNHDGIELPWKLNRELILSSTCFLGYRLQVCGLYNALPAAKQNKGRYLIAVAGLGAILLLCSRWIKFDAYSCQFSFPGAYPLFALLGLMLCVAVSKLFSLVNGVNQALAYIGRHTLVILLLHVISFKAISYLYIAFHDLPISELQAWAINGVGFAWIILYVLAGLSLPLLVQKLAPSKHV